MKRPGRISWLVLAMGLAGTALGVAFVASSERARDQRQLDGRAADLAAALHERLELYEATLFATRSYFRSFSEEMTEEAFAEYVNGLELDKRLPGLLGIGFARLVQPEEVRAFEMKQRLDGHEHWRVWPESPSEPMFPIVMLEPDVLSNEGLMGYNMFADPTRREAMTRAWLTGEAAMTGPVALVGRTGPDAPMGFLIYASVWTARVSPREKGFKGFVYAPFRLSAFVSDALTDTRASDLRIKLYDGAAPDAEKLIFQTDEQPCDSRHALATMEVGGRSWTIQVGRGEGFVRSSFPGLSWAVGVGGLLATALLFVTARGQERRRELLDREARRSAFIADAATRLGNSLEQSQTLVALVWLLVPALARRGIVAARGENGLVVASAERGGEKAQPTEHPLDDGVLPALAVRALEQETKAKEGAAMAVPLVARGRTIGVVFLEDPASDAPIAIDEFLSLAAIWVDNVGWFAKSQRDVVVREEFLSVASHEVRAPLASLKLQVEDVARKLRAGKLTPERLARALSVVERQTGRIVALIEELFDVSRLAHKQLQLHRESVDLQALAVEVAQRLDSSARESGCELVVEPGEPLVGVWDGFRLEQVLTNLVSNAIKYGNGHPVSVRVYRGAEGAHVEVEDHGIGIASQDLGRIFERFGRASGATRFAGLGLGLFIVRELVEAMGGRIGVRSEAGVGSTFCVVLPLLPPEEESDDFEK